MTDDLTRPIETPTTDATMPATEPMPAAESAAVVSDAAATATAPVSASIAAPVAASGSNRTRWIIGLGAAALAVAVAIGAVLVLGRPATPSALQYVPGDAAMVAEVRLDLPGDQMQHLGNVLAHFPGFQDQSTLTTKIDEALAKLVQSSGDTSVNYQADVKPWLAGATFVSVLNLTTSTTPTTPSEVVISATTNGAASCTAVFKNQTVTHETYRNLDLVLSSSGDMACVLDGRQALLGDPATVRKSLDAKAAGTGMDKNQAYGAARTALGGDRLATVFVNGASLQALMPNDAALGVPGLSNLLGAFPDWIMSGLRAEDDAFVLDYVAAPVSAPSGGPSLLPVPATHPSVITGMVPADTLLFVEAQGAGAGLQNLLTMLAAVPDLKEPLQMLDGLGGGAELVGWIDDVGVAASMHGTTPDLAILLVAKDEAAVTSRVSSLKTMLGLVGLGDGVKVTETTVNGVAVTTVTITDLGSIIPPGSVPGMGDIPLAGPVSFSIAAHGKVLLVTSGEAAMTAILNTAAGSSLADNAAYKHTASRGLANSRMTIYVAVGPSVDLVKGFLPAEALAQYQTDAAPYLVPIEGILISTSSDAAGNRSRVVLTVSQP